MTSKGPKTKTLGDSLPSDRKRWADFSNDSEAAKSRDICSAPINTESYEAPAPGMDKSQDGLNKRVTALGREKALEEACKSGPIDFSDLLGSSSTSSNTSRPAGDAVSSSSGSQTFNADAAPFVPTGSVSSMPPPALPSATSNSKRRRGKRTLSSVQENGGKRPREQAPASATEASASQPNKALPTLEPPPASEEEWTHRIQKRNKVVKAIKEGPEYREYFTRRPSAERLPEEPLTPTAEDRSLSKRRWEYLVQQWRTNVKQWAADNIPAAELQALMDEEQRRKEAAESTAMQDDEDYSYSPGAEA